jgi:GT2 family glycosyltransferase
VVDVVLGRAAPPRLLVLITSHNRRDLTLECLDALQASARNVAQLHVILVDAGSSDGTREAVRKQYPDTQIVEQDSEVYWTTGMRLGWEAGAALAHEFVLWLNDDLAIRRDAISSLLTRYEELSGEYTDKLIVVGRVKLPKSPEIAYGGYSRRAGSHSRLSWQRTENANDLCETFNGNCVLLPRRAFQEIGNLSRVYRHSLGDIDYGLRAQSAGYRIVQTSTAVGEQGRNLQVYSGARLKPSLRNLQRLLRDPKALPPREWLHFCRSHGGKLWPLNFVIRYVRAFSG